jgi:AAA domain/Bifunctional DNA primase/polymerase, N-terminal/Primase C terminal 2 (PriCT-2)
MSPIVPENAILLQVGPAADHQARLAAGQECLDAALHMYLPLGLSLTWCCDPDHVGVGKNHRCTSPGKRPMHEWKDLQGERHLSAEELTEQHRAYPIGNLGCVLGQASGLVRVDIDGDAGQALLAEWSGGDLPDTWSFVSSATGRGLLYGWPRDLPCKTTTQDEPGTHTELRLQGNGAQTILPPSRHASGSRYTWEPGKSPTESPLAPAPGWLLTRMQRTPRANAEAQPTAPADLPDRALLAGALFVIPPTTYNDWLHVGMALHGTGQPWARTLWDAWSAADASYDTEVQEIKWGSFGSREHLFHLGQLFDLARHHGWRHPDALRTPPETKAPLATAARVHAVRISARELRAKKIDPLIYVVEDILPAGCTLLTGKSKDGKSLMAYDIAVAVASDGVALGRYHVTQGSVWYLALEDGERRAQKRLQLMEKRAETSLPDAALDKIEFTLWKAPRLTQGLEEDLTEWMNATPDARLVIIDILEKIRAPRKMNGNPYAEDYNPTATLTELAQQRNVAILVIHHANKLNPDDFRDSASGCMSLIGGADNYWSLRRMPQSVEGTLNIIGRDIEQELELAMQFKDGYWTVLGLSALVRISLERQAIADVLREIPRPLTPKQIASACSRNYNTTKLLLRKMLDDGIVMQPTEGHYALSPSFLSSTVNPINPINPINPLNPINPAPENGMNEGDGFTRVYGGFMAEKSSQLLENKGQSGDTVYGFTGFMGFTPETCIHEYVNDFGVCNDCGLTPEEDRHV